MVKEKSEITRHWEEIYRKYTDPNEIKKKQREKIKQQIREDKKSSFVIYGND